MFRVKGIYNGQSAFCPNDDCTDCRAVPRLCHYAQRNADHRSLVMSASEKVLFLWSAQPTAQAGARCRLQSISVKWITR